MQRHHRLHAIQLRGRRPAVRHRGPLPPLDRDPLAVALLLSRLSRDHKLPDGRHRG